MSGVIVIVAYRPKPGKEKELIELVRNRVPTLRKEDLVTDRAPIIMCARATARLSRCRNGNRRKQSMPRTKIRTFMRCGTNFLRCAIAFR
jgi:hypothetical protein